MAKIGIVLATLIVGCIATACADQSSSVACPKVAGMIREPMVPTPTVAREIYLAVLQGRGEEVLPENIIEVRDAADHWVVFQYPSDSSEALGTRGGGTLEMTLNKCSGTILAHYSR